MTTETAATLLAVAPLLLPLLLPPLLVPLLLAVPTVANELPLPPQPAVAANAATKRSHPNFRIAFT
ncbi:MAG: hypothetical protein ACRESY_06560 [Steroidobacteraceae bacterium]